MFELYGISIPIILILAAIILIFALIGIKRGFVKELISLLSVVIALVIAFMLSAPCADFIYDSMLSSPVQEKLTESLPDYSTEDTMEAISNALPESCVSAANSLGIDVQSILNNIASEYGEASQTALISAINEKVVRPLLTNALRVFIFIILFIIIRILLALVAKASDIITKIPGIHAINKFLGFILGFAKGCIIAFIVFTAIETFSSFL